MRSPFAKLRNTAAVAVLCAAAAFAAPASATVWTYNYTTTAGSDAADTGTAGNSVVFSYSVTGGGTITATATGWNATLQTSGVNNGKYLITQAYLGSYTGGLGVTSAANDDLNYDNCGLGQCGTHQIDNMGNTANSASYDFIRLTFSAPVTLGSMTRNAFGSSNAAINGIDFDDDFSYGKGSTISNNMVVSSLSSLFTTNVGANGACDSSGDNVCTDSSTLSTSSQATAATASSNWYIAASIGSNYGGDGKVDAFKVAGLTAYSVAAVPEPESWAMMLMGFGAIGYAMRRRSQPLRLLFAQ